MTMPATFERAYLDNAATSWPKPPAVLEAVQDAIGRLGAPAGRGTYQEATEVERAIQETRRAATRLIGGDRPERMLFTSNGTDSLNLALHGTLRTGDHVVTTVAEHNSVLRPLKWLERHGIIQVTRVETDGIGLVDLDDLRRAIRPETRLLALTHVSNVTGTCQPVDAAGELAAEHGLLYLVDAAQSLGHLTVDVKRSQISLLAAPGHKGLLGPLGTGLLYVAGHAAEQLQPIRQGGTGTASENDDQPDSWPDRFESGNHNVPGILGLGAGIGFLQQHGPDEVARRSEALVRRLVDGLCSLEGVIVHGAVSQEPTSKPQLPDAHAGQRVGLVSISVAGFEPQEVASLLDSAYSIQVRAGFHCAPLMHRALKTDNAGGTIRLSVGPFTLDGHIDRAIQAVEEISASAVETPS